MKKLPFNVCDYRCERCLEAPNCAVYKTLQERLQGTDGEVDTAVLLEELRRSFRETEEMIKQKAREAGIDIDEIAGVSTANDVREKDGRTREDPLFNRAEAFMRESEVFLRSARPGIGEEEHEYLNDIQWHHTIVPAKLYRALGWRTDEEMDVAFDAKNSAAVAIKSLTICGMSFEHLASSYPGLAEEATRLAASARDLKQKIKVRFQIGSR